MHCAKMIGATLSNSILGQIKYRAMWYWGLNFPALTQDEALRIAAKEFKRNLTPDDLRALASSSKKRSSSADPDPDADPRETLIARLSSLAERMKS
jgi:hypothetical protein